MSPTLQSPLSLSSRQRAFHPPTGSFHVPKQANPDYLLPLPSPSSSQTFSSSSSFSSKALPKFLTEISKSRILWLALYFFFNLGLTLYNKLVLVHFPFPYTLTAIHALFGTLGGHCLAWTGFYVPSKLNRKEMTVLVAFSTLYSINIAVSNLSLQLVTVPFHQVVRAATPIFVIVLSSLFLGKYSSRAKIISLIPVVLGVALATYGDYYFTVWGLLLTLLGTILAALKTIFTNVLQSPHPQSVSDSKSSWPDHQSNQTHWKPSTAPKPIPRFYPSSFPSLPSPNLNFIHTLRAFSAKLPMTTISTARLHLHPLDLLHLLSPLALIQCLLLAHLSGELGSIFSESYSGFSSSHGGGGAFKMLGSLALNGLIAFGLNVVSFSANKKVGALGIAVAANIKQVLTILFAVSLFDLRITPLNLAGILLTLGGGAWFARVEWVERVERERMRKTAI